MSVPAPLRLHQEPVRPEWIDYNGHMNVAYYVLAFDRACDAFLDFVGMDEGYRRCSGGTTFAVECHVTYRREVSAGDLLCFTSQLLACDNKRIHHFHSMYRAEEDYLAATCEWLSLHVDLGARRVVPMGVEIAARLTEILEAHKDLPRPPEAGRGIAMPAPTTLEEAGLA